MNRRRLLWTTAIALLFGLLAGVIEFSVAGFLLGKEIAKNRGVASGHASMALVGGLLAGIGALVGQGLATGKTAAADNDKPHRRHTSTSGTIHRPLDD
jgi:hypothetical protein